MAVIQTKQELYDAIGLTLIKVRDPLQARGQIEALIDSFLTDLTQGICDAIVGSAEENIRSLSGPPIDELSRRMLNK